MLRNVTITNKTIDSGIEKQYTVVNTVNNKTTFQKQRRMKNEIKTKRFSKW